jgi:hypothetical protein
MPLASHHGRADRAEHRPHPQKWAFWKIQRRAHWRQGQKPSIWRKTELFREAMKRDRPETPKSMLANASDAKDEDKAFFIAESNRLNPKAATSPPLSAAGPTANPSA